MIQSVPSSSCASIWKRTSLLVLLLLPIGAAQAAWQLEKTTGNTLSFKNDQTNKTESLRVEASNPNFISILTDPESGTAYAFYEARACEKCDASQTSLYLQRIDGKGKATSFVPPGKIIDTKKGALVYEGRLFYGHCLPSVKQGLVTHQRELVDRRGMQKSVLIAEPGPQYVYELLVDKRLPSLNTTLDLVRKKSCFEVSGRTRNVLRKPLDLSPKKGLDDEEDDDEEAKEKTPSGGDSATES